MSREHIMFPSAKQILSYQQGDININDVHDFFRFHSGDKYYWIEKNGTKFRVCFRGFLETEFVSNFKVLYEDAILNKCIFYFNRLVYRLLGSSAYALQISSRD